MSSGKFKRNYCGLRNSMYLDKDGVWEYYFEDGSLDRKLLFKRGEIVDSSGKLIPLDKKLREYL